mmetsp:Transcript_65851/g.122879  ORF Transcript_65851/g.122879 Transcript_65851/m.122879 type:complete len:569 (+) Transcript_65851:40-1746(+)
MPACGARSLGNRWRQPPEHPKQPVIGQILTRSLGKTASASAIVHDFRHGAPYAVAFCGILLATSRAPRRAACSHAAMAAPATKALSPEFAAKEPDSSPLVEWLDELGTRGLEGIRIAQSPMPQRGMAVFAARDFEIGEELCFVPGRGILSTSTSIIQVPEDAEVSEAVKEAATSLEARLAAALLREKHLEESSRFAPYITSLPKWLELAPFHPLHWPADISLDHLFAGSPNGHMLATNALQNGKNRAVALLVCGEAKDMEEALWALTVVETRCFSFRAGQPDMELALIPLLDILNTFAEEDGCRGDLWQASFEPLCAAADGGRMVVERSIRAGEEIVHLYESNSSARLWTTYGFLPDGKNPFEGAALKVPLQRSGKDDHCAQAKLDALQDAGIELHGGNTLHFELPGDAEVGGALLPVARLLACRDCEQVLELAPKILAKAERDRPASLKPENLGLQLELEARLLVLQWLTTALEESKAAAADLSVACRQEGDTGKQALLRMALKLLELEKPELEYEARATRDFCDEAQRLGFHPWEAAPSENMASPELINAFVEERWDDEAGWMGAG